VTGALGKYLRTRAAGGPWELEGCARGGFAGAVVIPALAEEASLFATLASLAANPAPQLSRCLILVVVNHRASAPAAEQADNRRLLQRLRRGEAPPELALAWVDASSPGRELPEKDGVGLARKLGLDLALSRLDWSTAPFLACLDADTLVEPTYLAALQSHFARAAAGGAVLPFRHQEPADPAQRLAIEQYELFLRTHQLGLALAGSPYAYISIGSALACRAQAYLRCGGMNRRCAGEDFYFLQQLAKTCGLAQLQGTCVHPSARPSRRTPFGTGRSVERLLAEGSGALLGYPPQAYRLLGDWLQLVARELEAGAEVLLQQAQALHPDLASFLRQSGWERIWPQLARNHPRPRARLAAFHGWFDALKTVQLIHRLCAGPWPRQSLQEVLPDLLAWAGRDSPATPSGQLERLRQEGCGLSSPLCPL
jgi:hypothetical protein